MSRQAKAIQVAIDLMIREGNARVLANPKIATLNGKAATMLVGQRIPFQVTGTTFAGGGAAQTTQVQREEVGIKLSITPLINADGYITTVIRPEVSSVTGFRGANNDLPVVSTRQAETTVRLKDGSSVIIGGLLSEEKSSNVTKVPILGDIPVLGSAVPARVVIDHVEEGPGHRGHAAHHRRAAVIRAGRARARPAGTRRGPPGAFVIRAALDASGVWCAPGGGAVRAAAGPARAARPPSSRPTAPPPPSGPA